MPGKSNIGDKLDEALKHYGVKGMKWGVRRASSDVNFEPVDGGGGGGGGIEEEELTADELAEKLAANIAAMEATHKEMVARQKEMNETTSKLEAQNKALEKSFDEAYDDIKSKVGDGPLDMLRYIFTGKTREVKPKDLSTKEVSKRAEAYGKELRGKLGDGPMDALKYIITGKTKNERDSKKTGNGPLEKIKSTISGIFNKKKSLTHSGASRGITLKDIDDKYKESGREIVESLFEKS